MNRDAAIALSTLLLALAAAVVPPPAHAHRDHDEPAPALAAGDHRGGGRLFGPPPADVPEWNRLTPDQQRRLQWLRERWHDLPPARRVRALERLRRLDRWAELGPEDRARLREGARNFRDLPPELKARMRASFAAIHALPEPDRQRLLQRWRTLTPGQRRAWLEAGGPGLVAEPVATN